MNKKRIINLIYTYFRDSPLVIHALIYGSWLHEKKSIDLDIAVFIKSNNGVVSLEDYKFLQKIRQELSEITQYDVDLVPHTEDEINDQSSLLWFPKFNPTLVFGKFVKGRFDLKQISRLTKKYSFTELTKYIMHDTRVICRRQLIRSLDGEQGRIFVGKILHGVSNYLTYSACNNSTDFICSPSDTKSCFKHFDNLNKTDSTKALRLITLCKENIDFINGVKLLNWYENLFNLTLKGSAFKDKYLNFCKSM